MNENSTTRLVLYGGPSSQPTRAVYWTCLMQGLPLELRMFGSWLMHYAPEFRRLNPRCQVPTILDGDFALFEMPAILVYLCEKHGWRDLLPADVQARARVHQYLHTHHTLTRHATLKLMAPHVTNAFVGMMAENASLSPQAVFTDFVVPAQGSKDVLAAGRKVVAHIAAMIESGWFPAGSTFLCGTAAPTIADIACYEELAQLTWAGLFDFSPYPRLVRWMQAMAQLPHHDAAHRYGIDLGDIAIALNTAERYQGAMESALSALRGLGMKVVIVGERRADSA
ncbi:MAG: glutathione S-transferase family protein [Gammaproteobacteria bacterium]